MRDHAQRNQSSRSFRDAIDGPSSNFVTGRLSARPPYSRVLCPAPVVFGLCQGGCQELTHPPLRKIERSPGPTSADESDMTAVFYKFEFEAIVCFGDGAHLVQDRRRQKRIV